MSADMYYFFRRKHVMNHIRKPAFLHLKEVCRGLCLACVIVDVFCQSHTLRKTLVSAVWL